MIGGTDIDPSWVLDLAAIMVLLAGVFVVARYKAALDASESSAASWHELNEASHEKVERLEARLQELRAENAALKARPDVSQIVQVLSDHEANANKRHEAMLIVMNALVEKLSNIPQAPST